MAIVIKNVTSLRNGGAGLFINGDFKELTIDCVYLEGNSAGGLVLHPSKSKEIAQVFQMLRKCGPVDLSEVVSLYEQVSKLHPIDREEAVRRSPLWEKILSVGADAAQIVSLFRV
jgi:hypothetical protein